MSVLVCEKCGERTTYTIRGSEVIKMTDHSYIILNYFCSACSCGVFIEEASA